MRVYEVRVVAWDGVVGSRWDGWTFGPTKDSARKTHPRRVPFDQLPESEKTKEAIIIGVVKALVPVLGVTGSQRSDWLFRALA